jgi:hypothetical protein
MSADRRRFHKALDLPLLQYLQEAAQLQYVSLSVLMHVCTGASMLVGPSLYQGGAGLQVWLRFEVNLAEHRSRGER